MTCNITNGGSKGVLATRPFSRFNFFYFHAVFGKYLPNNRLAQPLLELAPPLGDPGSTTDYCKIPICKDSWPVSSHIFNRINCQGSLQICHINYRLPCGLCQDRMKIADRILLKQLDVCENPTVVKSKGCIVYSVWCSQCKVNHCHQWLVNDSVKRSSFQCIQRANH